MKPFTNRLMQQAQKYRAVAFDVFGTLLVRNVSDPTDVFRWMEEDGRVQHGFAQRRIQAEQEVRQTSTGEISLAQIYAHPLMEGESWHIELEYEKRSLRANPLVFQSVKTLCEQEKSIYIISDMYLSAKQVYDLLVSCGYTFLRPEQVFVSSEYGVQKRSGRLFALFLQKVGLTRKDVLFVGDDVRVDCIGSALVGIKSLRVPPLQPLTYTSVGTDWKSNANIVLLQHLQNELSPEASLGAEVVGPPLIAFTEWIERCVQDLKEPRIFFLARDMALVRQLYNTRFPMRETDYLQVSRRSLIPALLQRPMNEETLALLADALPRQILSVENILTWCGFPSGTCLKNYTLDQKIDLKCRPLGISTKEFLCTVVACSKTNAGIGVRHQASLARQYLDARLRAPSVLVDIGSGGTTQRLLRALGYPVQQGLYLACDERLHQFFPASQAKAFLFRGKPAPLWFWVGQPMLERLISEQVGPTVGYCAQGRKVEPLHTQGTVSELVMQIQNGVLQYSVSLQQFPCAGIPNADSIEAFLKLVRRPRQIDVLRLGDLTVEDGEEYPLASSRPWYQYCLRPKAWKSDLNQARWKIGFLKRTLHIPLPYDCFYEALKQQGR